MGWPPLRAPVLLLMGPRQRDLLPFPLPFSHSPVSPAPVSPSRCSLRRLHAKRAWQTWANDGALTLNALNGTLGFASCSATPPQAVALGQFCSQFKLMGPPPSDFGPARAFTELCGQTLPYFSNSCGPAPFKEDLVALPAGHNDPVDPFSLLSAEHSELLKDEVSLLQDPLDLESSFERNGVSQAYVDPAFKNPKVYGEFLKKLYKKVVILYLILLIIICIHQDLNKKL